MSISSDFLSCLEAMWMDGRMDKQDS